MIPILLLLMSAQSAEPEKMEPPVAGAETENQTTPVSQAKPPELLYAPTPTYPAEALQQGISGTVLLALDVSSTGQVVNAEVLESERDDLAESALINARAFRFSPPKNALLDSLRAGFPSPVARGATLPRRGVFIRPKSHPGPPSSRCRLVRSSQGAFCPIKKRPLREKNAR